MIDLNWIRENLFSESGKYRKTRGDDWLKANHPNVLSDIFEATPLCKGDVKNRARSLLDGVKSDGCAICCSPVEYQTARKAFRQYCSTECQSVGAKDKRIATLVERYGVVNPGQSEEMMERGRRSSKEKYGVEHYNQQTHVRKLNSKTSSFRRLEVKAKIKKTLESKYGGHHLRNKDILAKLKATNRVLYGVDFQSQRPEIKEQIREKNIERYGVENYTQTPEYQEKRKATSLERYGVPHAAKKHLTQYGIRLSEDAFFETEFEEKSVADICILSGYTREHVLKRSIDLGLRDPFESSGEKAIREYVESLGYTATKSRSVIPPYEIDVWVPEANLGIEYCGHYWHSEAVNDNPKYHQMKWRMMTEANHRLITIYEGEWELRQETVKRLIRNALGVDKRSVYARKCEIIVPTMDEERAFYEAHHIQGWVGSTACLGLKYEDDIVALMSFTRVKNNRWDLVRFASSIRVIGGASKLLRYFTDNNQWTEIVSFADLRTSQGNLYYTLGFDLDKIIPPSYGYVRRNSLTVEHKFGHRKKRYSDKYDITSMTEKQIMEAEGYHRIWDCGKMRFVLKNIT